MAGDLYDRAYMSRWFESFVIFAEALPDKISVAGHAMTADHLLAVAARLRALAQPDGWLRGRQAEPYSIAQLTPWLSRGDRTVRRILRYLEETGWMATTPRTNQRLAEARRLVIPSGVQVAWAGWPRSSRSSGHDQDQPSPHEKRLSSGHDQDQAPPHEPEGSSGHETPFSGVRPVTNGTSSGHDQDQASPHLSDSLFFAVKDEQPKAADERRRRQQADKLRSAAAAAFGHGPGKGAR